MTLAAIDVQQQQFETSFRGYHRREVRGFLDMVAGQLAEQAREINDVRAELRRVTREVQEHRDREETMKQAMLTAQRALDELREQAQKEAQVIVTQAEVRAEKVMHNASSRAERMVDDLQDLKRQRARLVEEVRAVLNTHQRLLELHLERDNETPESKVDLRVLKHLRAPKPPGVPERNPEDLASHSAVSELEPPKRQGRNIEIQKPQNPQQLNAVSP